MNRPSVPAGQIMMRNDGLPGTISPNGSEPLSFESLLRSSGPFALGGEAPSDDELFTRLDLFGVEFWRVGRATEREAARQMWVEYLDQKCIPTVVNAWRVVQVAIDAGKEIRFISGSKNGPDMKRIGPRLVDEVLADPNLLGEPAWVVHGYAARGEVMLLGGPPKAGKSTFLADLACHVAGGIGYIGQRVQEAPVLWIDLEQHPRRTAALFRRLQGDGLPLHISSERPIRFDLQAYIQEHGIGLVVIDSLSKFWAVEDENDAVQVTAAIEEIRHLALVTDAAIVLIDHTRKSGGEDGTDIRGSGAKTASVDIAVSFKRDHHGADNRRILDAISRSDETPRKLVIAYEDDGYRPIGILAEVRHEQQRNAILEALRADELTTKEIAEAADVSQIQVHRITSQLFEEGSIGREGRGKKGDPFRFSRKEVTV